jgi:drug/metabolite transporter (DMT)-like permease
VTETTQTRATIALLASTLLWGTWWIPLRQLDQAGVNSTWAMAAPMLLPLFLMAPFALPHRRRILAAGWPAYLAGFLVALAIALYAEGLLRGYIARVVLLFYLAPVWSALLGRIFLGVPITPGRMLTIALGLTGMVVIFGADAGVPLPDSAAEWMALLSGITWAGALVFLNRAHSVPAFDKSLILFLFLGGAYIGLASIPGGGEWALPSPNHAGPVIFWIFVVALIWVLPLVLLTMYAASSLDPAKVSILLTLEVVIGLVTAALLTDEPFGVREVVGAVLILTAGLVELWHVPRQTPIKKARTSER